MSDGYVDPIAHAWRHCNPHTPLPSTLAQRAVPPGFGLRLFSSNSELVTEWSGTKDTQHGLLTIAILPTISAPIGE